MRSLSGVDCLDLISQTSPGQEMLRKLKICIGPIIMMRLLSGILPRILRRMHGLQQLQISLGEDWNNDSRGDQKESIEECKPLAQGMLRIIKRDLGYIKEITVTDTGYHNVDAMIVRLMNYELAKRNEAWTAPLPAYKDFRRTSSSMLYVETDMVKWALWHESFHSDEYAKADGIGPLENENGDSP